MDTPRKSRQFGSLIVALPVAHKGGELLVRSQRKEIAFDWSQLHDDAPAIKWAAFYSDCEHEVLEVTSGNRITLTYNLFTSTSVPGGVAGQVGGPLDSTKLPLYAPLKEALETPGFMRTGTYSDEALEASNYTFHRLFTNPIWRSLSHLQASGIAKMYKR